jgi:hypothetical protein
MQNEERERERKKWTDNERAGSHFTDASVALTSKATWYHWPNRNEFK